MDLLEKNLVITAYNRGWEAGYNGLDRNPPFEKTFIYGPKLNAAWEDGWVDGQEEAYADAHPGRHFIDIDSG